MKHTTASLNELAHRVHKANIKWWQHLDTKERIERDPDELLALVISEVCECLEGERKNLPDDKLPHRKMAEVEMADAYIRLLDFSAGFKIDLQPYDWKGAIPTNKGAALFKLMKWIIKIENVADSETYITMALAYIEAYCNKHAYDLWGAFEEKMAFNAVRVDHTHEARKLSDGKAF